MPSSYSPKLRFTLPVTGELSGLWGDTVNAGVTELVEAAIAGRAAVAMTDANYTLTTVNGAADEARQMALSVTGTLTAARNVVCPTSSKLYFITNSTTGGFAITLKTTAGTGISVPNGKSMVLACDGTNVIDAVTYFSSLTLGTALPVASGGTGATTAAAARTALGVDAAGTIPLNPAQVEVTLTDGATVNWDMDTGHIAKWTITATGRTLAAPTNYKTGGQYQLLIKLNTPSTMTPTWPSIFKFPFDVAPDLTTSSYTLFTLAWSTEHTKFLVFYSPGF